MDAEEQPKTGIEEQYKSLCYNKPNIILYDPPNRYENTVLFKHELIAVLIFMEKYKSMNVGTTNNYGEMVRHRLGECLTMYAGDLYLERYGMDGRLVFRNKLSNMTVPNI